MSTATDDPQPRGGRVRGGAWRRLFTGQTGYDFVGQGRRWLVISAILLTLCVAAVAVRQLNFSIDFTGGTAFIVSGATAELDAGTLRTEIGALIEEGDILAQVVNDPETGTGALVTTPVLGEVAGEDQAAVLDRLAELTGVERSAIDVNAVGPRWGAEISGQALRGLVVFLLLVVVYLALRFEWKMAVAALAALAHDIIVTIGIYALVGFDVSPSSVIALLTILGYSLYDTVVVFDRVTEETAGLNLTSSRTYGEIANDALNHVLVRSLSTSVTSLLPVGSLLFVGGGVLGADTLSDLALALFVGMGVGTYSSIFVATPLLVWLKEREPRFAELKDNLLTRRGAKGPPSDRSR